MKRITFIRLSGIAIILSLLFILVPVLPVYAAHSITLSVSVGKIGDSVTVYGDFDDSASERFANVYFSSSNLTIGLTSFITAAPSYKFVGGEDIPISSAPNSGNFTVTFPVPSILNSGTVAQNVTSGTYYVLVTYLASTGVETGVQAKAAFTVTAPTLDPLSPVYGPAGTDVLITGSYFTAGATITVTLDGTTIPIKTGAETTVRATGAILTTVTIPATAALGAHTISVTTGGFTVSKTFTVTAAPVLNALNPASGPPGTHIAISGANFPASTQVIFQFDTTFLTPTGSPITLADGSFACVITIPANATVTVHTITVTAGSTVKTASFTVTQAATTPPPTATLNAPTPDSGPPGANLAISGSGFAASSALVVTFNATTPLIISGMTQTDANGSFSGTIIIPSDAAVGIHTITVTTGATSATATFTVTEPATTTPTPTTGTTFPLGMDMEDDFVGASISIASSGFIPNSSVTVAIDGVQVAEDNANESGFFIITFSLPSILHGEHTISASDGTNTATADFTVESTAPGTPLPLSPMMGEAISSPASFNWEDGNDPSRPVTYNLQIATTDAFESGTILIDKIGLTESQYTLTEAEQLMLAAEATYYWREQAVDAASNASDWTGAGEFTMIKPFEFTGWPLYLTIGLGGLVLFLLGLWVGRRTAFYY